MKGLTLAEKYYYEIGRPMLETQFPEFLPRIAAGLMGDGSECLRFDDDISQDHDFGPGFCLWLDSEDFQKIGVRMQEAYQRLPKLFHGFPARNTTAYGSDRIGVIEIHEFFSRYIGAELPPHSLFRWLTLPEEKLAALTAGKIFEDPSGKFTQLKNALHYYPEDVRLKKIAASAMRMAQSGQYNYARCMQRGDTVAADFALTEFVKAAITITHQLNRCYTPYYKWMYRSLQDLPVLNNISVLIQELSETPLQKAAWSSNTVSRFHNSAPNLSDKKVQLIEEICRLIIEELEHQSLITKTDTYLGSYPLQIIQKITDSELKSLHILIG